jgi:hypothetical protein
LADSRVAQSASDRAEQLASSNDRATIIFSVFSEMIKTAQLTDEQRRWAETRWLFEAVWSFTNSLRCDRRHTISTLVATFSSLAIPVAAGIATADSHLGSWARIITLIIGLVGATAVATEKVMHNGPRWRLYRSSYEDLAAEGWAFFNKAEKYEKLAQDERFGLFFEKVEKIIASRGQRYFVEIASLDEPAVHNGK